MAGHSKWANIRFRKGAQDAKRAKIFTKCIREITIASRIGGGDPGANPRLRTAIDKGLANNMPKDKIEKAIKRGTGDTEGVNYEEIRYEGYGPGGVAVLVDCTTDNRNRTVSEVRHAFTKMGGNLGTDGSVAYLFSKLGVLTYADGSNEEAIMDAALEAGADDVITDEDGSIEVITTAEQFAAVRDAMVAADLKPEMAEISQRASTQVTLSPDDAETMLKLLDALEDLDDVQNVYSNADFPDEVLQQQAG
ncbi:MAG: Dot/Icm type IV secretion system effector transcriptional regulator CvpC [Gammaproteobacteria bacterium]|nr:MAG: Dot/Icm type IV secretion system effector transcriptional regulator CvpC [Gammaproteobacteria bacterium]